MHGGVGAAGRYS